MHKKHASKNASKNAPKHAPKNAPKQHLRRLVSHRRVFCTSESVLQYLAFFARWIHGGSDLVPGIPGTACAECLRLRSCSAVLSLPLPYFVPGIPATKIAGLIWYQEFLVPGIPGTEHFGCLRLSSCSPVRPLLFRCFSPIS